MFLFFCVYVHLLHMENHQRTDWQAGSNCSYILNYHDNDGDMSITLECDGSEWAMDPSVRYLGPGDLHGVVFSVVSKKLRAYHVKRENFSNVLQQQHKYAGVPTDLIQETIKQMQYHLDKKRHAKQ